MSEDRNCSFSQIPLKCTLERTGNTSLNKKLHNEKIMRILSLVPQLVYHYSEKSILKTKLLSTYQKTQPKPNPREFVFTSSKSLNPSDQFHQLS